jgi:hypothetical protein
MLHYINLISSSFSSLNLFRITRISPNPFLSAPFLAASATFIFAVRLSRELCLSLSIFITTLKTVFSVAWRGEVKSEAETENVHGRKVCVFKLFIYSFDVKITQKYIKLIKVGGGEDWGGFESDVNRKVE